MTEAIAFQGAPGANSDLACRAVYPGRQTLPCYDFEDALGAVTEGRAALAMIPIENSVAGRVADVYHLLPHSGLHIIAEHFHPVHHQLLALPGSAIGDIRVVRSHVQALGQCRRFLREHLMTPSVAVDTAGAAADLAQSQERGVGVIASALAAEIYGLDIIASDIEDAAHNTTRFVVLARDPVLPEPAGLAVTTLVFRVRNVPAALYKALGGFATNGINMTKLESYMVQGSFAATEFYLDVEAHPAERRLQLALEELRFFTAALKILGTYPGHLHRQEQHTA